MFHCFIMFTVPLAISSSYIYLVLKDVDPVWQSMRNQEINSKSRDVQGGSKFIYGFSLGKYFPYSYSFDFLLEYHYYGDSETHVIRIHIWLWLDSKIYFEKLWVIRMIRLMRPWMLGWKGGGFLYWLNGQQGATEGVWAQGWSKQNYPSGRCVWQCWGERTAGKATGMYTVRRLM